MAELDLVGQSQSAATDVHRLYAEHAAELRLALARLCGRGVDGDDLLQEVFVVALRRLPELTRARSDRAWLYGVAVKLASGQRRRLRMRRWLGLEDQDELASAESPSRTLEQKEASILLQRALDTLPGAKRDVIVLFELQGLTGDEIATALSIPVATVWTRLFHARKALAAAVEALDPNGGHRG
jgi:RNA polymerase sigma-70 factor (ECF subfamily)